MKIIITAFLLCFVCISQSIAQTSDSLKYCVVILNDSGVYVPDMKIRVVSYKKKDAFLKNAATDLTGTACLTLAYGRDYNLIVDDSLYSRIKKRITPNKNSAFLSDTVFLTSKITSTDVINVEAQKDFMRIEDDKTIFDISKLGLDPGPNALELMKKIPILTVEGESVLLRGSPPKILINGRESEIYGDLKSIPTDLIDKVEIMTVAPSKYEADGNSGVINVILKKFEEAKYRVYLNTSGSTNNYYRYYEDLNYKKGDFSLFFNTNGALYNINSNDYSTTKNVALNELTLISYDTNKNNSKNIKLNPGIIFDATKNLYMGIEGVIGLGNNTGNTNSLRQYSYLPNQNQNLYGNRSGDNNTYSLVAYIDQKEIFAKDELSLEFNLNNTKNNSDFSQSEIEDNFIVPFSNGYSAIKNNNHNVKLDYTKKFGDNLKLETGLRDTYKKELNDYFSNDTSGAFASSYNFTQDIYSYYGTLSYNSGTFRFKPGLRIEYADLRGLVNSFSEFTNYKLDVFPSMTITKYLADNTQLQLLYGKKIERPRFTALNPFTIKRDVYNTTTGNPDLLPSYTHSFEFKFSKPLGKSYVNTNLYLKHNTDLIQSLKNIDSIYTQTTYINNGYSNEYGIDGGVRLSFSEFLYSNVHLRVNKKVYSDESLNAQSDRISYGLNASMGYSNPELFDANMYLYYNGRSYSPNSVRNSIVGLYLYGGKSFFNKKLTLNLSINDPFNWQNSESTYIRDGYELYNKSVGNFGQSVELSLSFVFGNYDEKRQKGKDVRDDDSGD